jgi:hypothetical protein
MKRIMGGAALLAAATAMTLPAGARAETACVGNTTTGACATADAACVVGSLKGNQYFQPCIRVQVYREFIPPAPE